MTHVGATTSTGARGMSKKRIRYWCDTFQLIEAYVRVWKRGNIKELDQ